MKRKHITIFYLHLEGLQLIIILLHMGSFLLNYMKQYNYNWNTYKFFDLTSWVASLINSKAWHAIFFNGFPPQKQGYLFIESHLKKPLHHLWFQKNIK